MIPDTYITEWQNSSPWKTRAMVEQDLLLSRILVELCSDDFIASRLVFRGGTALHKLVLDRPLRYSEDIDFVHITADEFRTNLDAKLNHPGFQDDCTPLLRPGVTFDPSADRDLIDNMLLALLD